MTSYGAFASVYDLMQYDVDYAFWSDKLIEKIERFKKNSRSGLELACGTGTLAIELSKRGFLMEGLDISDEMLSIAQHKSSQSRQKVRFFCQDMITFQTKKAYDFIFSMCDGINYILDNDDLNSTFCTVNNHLKASGLFIFDISSHYKLSKVIGDRTFAETFEETAYIWENQYDQESDLLEFELTLFNKVGAAYERHEEFHTQRAYHVNEIELLCEPYFEILEIVDGDTFENVKNTSQRICFICRKKETK
ncbi:class I SAM-dependent DNA methyltransferase [Fusibacter ferrireducens]|uniref:Class I SAM-dependent methyltransferase n=1 Tax=Fusibacter ferrireducens TaxID=2785058 RepID=A0ABR9ZQT9_9FIRM|nr:class I SAM-dependent methyltransferase [Fusibacter ferrireducens]MBF4692816.1 class I SAM-dependent methyltransferase [Fusibacter ferrireducens]